MRENIANYEPKLDNITEPTYADGHLQPKRTNLYFYTPHKTLGWLNGAYVG